MDQSQIDARRAFFLPSDRPTNRVTAKLPAQCVAHIWIDAAARPCAVAFMGKSAKPLGPYRFKSAESRAAWIRQEFNRARGVDVARAVRREATKAARAAGHKLTVGAILVSSWGYDQTNVDYYQVTALVGSTMVELRPIGAQSTEDHYMQGQCVPAPDAFTGPAARYRVTPEGDSVKVRSFSYARLLAPVADVAGVKVYPSSRWSSYA